MGVLLKPEGLFRTDVKKWTNRIVYYEIDKNTYGKESLFITFPLSLVIKTKNNFPFSTQKNEISQKDASQLKTIYAGMKMIEDQTRFAKFILI